MATLVMVPSDMDPQLSTQSQEASPVSGANVGQGTTFAQKDFASATTASTHPPRLPQPQTEDSATTGTARHSVSMTEDQQCLAKINVTINLSAASTLAASNPSASASASMPSSNQFNSTVHRPSLASEAALAAVKAVRENPLKVLSNGGDAHPDKDKDVEMDVEGDETEDEIHTARHHSVNGHHHDEDADGEGEGDEEEGYEANPTTSGGGSGDGVDGAGQAPARSQPSSQHTKRKQGRQRKNASALPSSSQHSSSSTRQQTTPPPSVSSPPPSKDDSPLDGQNVTEEKYRRLKRKLKEVLQENERMAAELERSHRRVHNLRKEKNLLLDKIIQYERGHESESVSELSTSLSSDSESSDESLYSRRSERPWSSSSRHANGGRRDGSSTSSARHPAAASGSAGSGPQHPRKSYKTSRRRSPSASGIPHPAGSASAAAASAAGEGDGADGHRHLSPSASRGPSAQSAARNKEHKPAPVPSLITNVGSAFQKPKRIHTSAKQRATNMMKVKKVLPLPRDENGNVKLPCTIGILTVMNLGKVIWDREAFHNERYIWPVGYKMSRLYNSMIDKTSLTTYTCSVIDDGDAPKFMIEVGDQPGKPIIAGTATGAWTHVVKAANEIRKRDHSNSASGPDYFGFSNPTIAKLIQELPDADKCEHYIMQRFEEGTGRSGSTAQAAAGEKRRLGRAASSSAAGGEKEGKEGTEGGKEGDHESSKEDELYEEDDSDYVSLGTAGIKPPPAKKVKVGGTSSDHGEDASMAVDSGDASVQDKRQSHQNHTSSGGTAMEEDIDIEANDEEEEDHDNEHEEEEIDELDDDNGDDDDEDDVMAPAPPPAPSSSSSAAAAASSSSPSDIKQGPEQSVGHNQAALSGASTLALSGKNGTPSGKAVSILHPEVTPTNTTTTPASMATQEPVHSIATSTSSAGGSSGPAVVVTSE
ncbi:hypothetical protein BGZ73_003236 [Actinomortierella ambigua]|nr:hypothetical protein BGZ73_003236 [Actinomortierella ambigua]